MASLTETLGNYRPSGSSSYSYKPPKVNNPYEPLYGARQSFNPQGNQNLYASLLQRTQDQSARAFPTTRFQAQYDFDPILARISALGEMSIANARTEAAELRKRALIEAGDPDIARELGADANTIQAAQGNTFSTKARLDRDYAQRGRELDEAANVQNLFYSGERVRQLQEQERGRAEANVDFSKVLRDLLATAQYELTRAEEMDQQRTLEAALAAAARGGAVRPGGGAPPPGGGGGGTTVVPPGGVFPAGYHGTLQLEPSVDEAALLSYLFPPNDLLEDPYTYGLGGAQGY